MSWYGVATRPIPCAASVSAWSFDSSAVIFVAAVSTIGSLPSTAMLGKCAAQELRLRSTGHLQLDRSRWRWGPTTGEERHADRHQPPPFRGPSRVCRPAKQQAHREGVVATRPDGTGRDSVRPAVLRAVQRPLKRNAFSHLPFRAVESLSMYCHHADRIG